MVVIYYCFAGAHASVVSAAIHCGILPSDRVPTFQEFLSVPYYDQTSPELVGKPYFMGHDGHGHAVYFMGMWNQRQALSSVICEMLEAAGISPSNYILQDSFPLLNFSTKLGGALSKRFLITSVGRKISVWGIQRRYKDFVSLVESVKQRLE
ncbi:MAG: DUF3189 family protein [Negativicutes bacterium]|nr:DUF3189 family protein [Negativicutes bacterium]